MWTKVHDILVRWRRRLVVVNALDRLSISFFIPKTYAVKVAVKLRSHPKKVVLCSQFVWDGVSQISDMRFQITLTSDHVADFR